MLSSQMSRTQSPEQLEKERNDSKWETSKVRMYCRLRPHLLCLGEGGAVPGTRGLSVLQEQVQGEVRQPQPPSSRPLQKQERLRERTEEYIGVSLEFE